MFDNIEMNSKSRHLATSRPVNNKDSSKGKGKKMSYKHCLASTDYKYT